MFKSKRRRRQKVLLAHTSYVCALCKCSRGVNGQRGESAGACAGNSIQCWTVKLKWKKDTNATKSKGYICM